MSAAAAYLVAAGGLNVASIASLAWARRERRRLQALRYGIQGRGFGRVPAGRPFNDAERASATSRLRP